MSDTGQSAIPDLRGSVPRRKKSESAEGSEPLAPQEAGAATEAQPFLEVNEPEEPVRKPKARTLKLRVNEDAQIQFDSEEHKQRLLDAILAEPDQSTLQMVTAAAAAASQEQALITTAHAEVFLDLLGMVERLAIPPVATKLIQKQNKNFKGFHPVVVDKAFRFTDEQKASIAPLLAEVANDELPESWRIWIASIDKRWQLVGIMALTVRQQFICALQLQMQIDTGMAPNPSTANGKATPVEQVQAVTADIETPVNAVDADVFNTVGEA